MKPPTQKITDKRLASLKAKLTVFADRVLDKEALSAFSSLIADVCTKRRLTWQQLGALERSCLHMLNHAHTAKLIEKNAVRLLANWNFIADGMEIPWWDGSRETADAIVIGVRRSSNAQKLLLYLK